MYGDDIAKFAIQSSNGEFLMDGKIIDLLFYVFEAKSGHQANAATCSITRGQPDDDVDDDDENNEKFSVMGSANQPIRSEYLRHIIPPSLSSTSTSSNDSLIETSNPEPDEAPNDASIDDAILWHNRLGHRAISTLEKAGIVPKLTRIHRLCKACIEGKQKKLPYRRYEHNAPRTLWRVHSDMSGMSLPSIKSNYRYFITFVDDKSRYAWIYFTDRKDAKTIHDIFEPWKADAENKSGNKVLFLQTDEGGEYESVAEKLLERTGIMHLTSPPYPHQSNGLVERFNLTLKDAARTMMIHANLPQSFWAKAMVTATEIYNMLPYSGTGKIPYEEFWNLPSPSLNRYKVFGYIIETHFPTEIRPPMLMWDKRANRSIYVGTDSRSGYEYWDLRNNQFNHTHDCTFFENEFPTSDDFPSDPSGFQRPKRRTPQTISTILPETQPAESSDERPIYDTIVV
jgi:transposase InsO family protein